MMSMARPLAFYGEGGYLSLLEDILFLNKLTPDRTDVGSCIKLFNQTLFFNVGNSFPVSTVRPMSLRYGFEEIMMFLRGEVNTKTLEEKGINFWKGHTSREFLNSRGLHHLPEGNLGKSYSYQYRGLGEGYVDQIAAVVNSLKKTPYSRRHCVDIWAPNDHSGMPLTPCWKSHQFNVEYKEDNRPTLHLTCEVRSSDALFGLPSNYQQFAFYLVAMAKLVDMDVGLLCCNLNDVHIYSNQVDYVEELLDRDYFDDEDVKISINKELNTLDDLLSLQWEDIELSDFKVNKKPFITPKPSMAV